MIPQRIALKGFLCYKDEQVVDFSGPSTLWMLSGLNGSGKSAIFDAVTFALFGCHRGGSQRAVELINKDSRELIVEFDFGLDGKRYRARRTQKRDAKGGAKGTQQLLRLDAAHPEPLPIEDTQLLRNFDAWIGDNIGLDYETFTSSVLLLQGKAEKLLDSKPEGRREVLAGIVDLKRYEALHGRADQQRRAREGELKALSNRLAALPPVAPLELAAAANRIAAAEETRENARAEVERLQRLEMQAKAWLDLQDRLELARDSHRRAQELLDARADIERAMKRLIELRDVLPHLERIVTQRGETAKATKLIEELERERLKRREALVQKEDALKQARDKQKLTSGRIAEQDTRLREAAEGYRRSSEQMVKLKEYERQETDLERVREDRKRLPADPADVVRQQREAYDTLTVVHQAVPVLSRFPNLRDDLGRALERERETEAAQTKLRVVGEKVRAEFDALKPRLEEAVRELDQANERAAGARSLLQQARDSVKEADELHGAKVCRHCGQELKPGHVEDEKRRRGLAVKEAEKRSKEADAVRTAARAAEKQRRDELAEVEKRLAEMRDDFTAGRVQLVEAQRETQRLRNDLAAAYEELTPAFRQRIAPARPADWLATTYPDAAELTVLKNQAATLSALRVNLERAERQQRDAAVLHSRENACLDAMRRLQAELPQDRAGVRKEHERLELEKRTLEQTLEGHRSELRGIEKDLDRLGKEREQAQRDLIDLEGRIKKQELMRDSAEHVIREAKGRLPATWHEHADGVGLRQVSDWKAEREELERNGTELRSKDLQDARVKLDAHRRDVDALEAQQAAFPAEARRHPDQVRERLAEARRVERSCDAELLSAKHEQATLEGRQRQRAEIEQEHLNAERELAAEGLLSDLLGKNRLQLFLVRQAERQVVEHANAVLDRLSGGTLCLRLAGEAGGDGVAAKALELEVYNRVTGEKPINVAFLSGSQKFRVAVSLALGIGQYASRRHRPIESVIIDEGFGCLDRQGRQVMIQELQNLRSQMRCILLVSHQEEFADAFSDGYHFQLDGGATKVTRVQK